MTAFNDAQTAIRLVQRLVRSRSARRELARLAPQLDSPSPGSIQIAVYFADAKVNLYQIRQWYGPLAELSQTFPVAIISRSPSAMLDLVEESPVPVVYLRQIADLENFIADQQLKIVFYVNQNSKNFQMMRYGRMWHVFINHGESDKMYMTTNQFKAYDFSLVAGEAARGRLRQKIWDYDVDQRTIMIGRPQADHFVGELPYPPDDRTVVLYSPTWEGDREAAAYGSVVSHGVALASSILASDTHRLIYRPHPRTGVIDAEFKRANQAIIAAIAAANTRNPAARHVFDDGPTLGWQLEAADVAITDVSAMVYDRLATGKPLIVARPTSENADIDLGGYLGSAEWLDGDDAASIIEIIDRVQHSDEARERLEFWVKHHFGDTTDGVATHRFHEAVETLVDKWHSHAAIHAEDRSVTAPDRFDGDDDDDS